MVRIKPIRDVTGSKALVVNEVVGTIGVVFIVVLPWVLGGIDPSREDLTWAVLLSFFTAFFSLVALVLSAFDIASTREP